MTVALLNSPREQRSVRRESGPPCATLHAEKSCRAKVRSAAAHSDANTNTKTRLPFRLDCACASWCRSAGTAEQQSWNSRERHEMRARARFGNRTQIDITCYPVVSGLLPSSLIHIDQSPATAHGDCCSHGQSRVPRARDSCNTTSSSTRANRGTVIWACYCCYRSHRIALAPKPWRTQSGIIPIYISAYNPA